jgi:NodT family efflux transporter outer membrane factor (OMF) lipoprotein
VPEAWGQQLPEGLTDAAPDLAAWWEVFEDPVLSSLVARAVAGNQDLKLAAARVREARARLGVSVGDRYPAVGASGLAQRQGLSGETTPPGTDRTRGFFQFLVGATWEVDLWGRVSRSVESAEASVEASAEDYRDVLVLLCAEVAFNYMELRTVQLRLRYAEQNAEAQRGTLKLTRDRYEAELAPELDVAQAERILYATEALIPALRIQQAQAINRIAVLLGTYRGDVAPELRQAAPLPTVPGQVAVGVPAELLRQRPDVRSAERALAAQCARIGVATAELYPQLSLAGFLGVESFHAGDLLDDAGTYAYGVPLAWRLFEGGRLRAGIDLEDARFRQAAAAYDQTVLTAVRETEDAIAAYADEKVRRDALAKSVDAAERSERMFVELYRLGLTEYQNVLDAQRALVDQQDLLAESEGAIAADLVLLYRALGGGWEPGAALPGLEGEDGEREMARAPEGSASPTAEEG